MSNIEFRAVIKFLTKQGKSFENILIEIGAFVVNLALEKQLFTSGTNCLNKAESCLKTMSDREDQMMSRLMKLS